MSIEQEIQDLTQSTSDLLEAVNVEKATLDNAVATAEAAVSVATTKATEAASVVSSASTSATEASASAANAATSAASASQLVTGVDSGLPEVRPSLNLDFVNSKVVDSRIDFTRSTTATYYDGKTTVKAEENLLKNSSALDNSAFGFGGLTHTENATVAPDGTTTAQSVYNTTDVAHHWISSSVSAVPTNTDVTVSIYAKYIDAPYVAVGMNSIPSSVYGVAVFDVQTGALVNSAVQATMVLVGTSSTDVGNGWFRFSITFNTGGRNDLLRFVSGPRESTTIGSYGLEGNVALTGLGSYFWGAQLEYRDSLTAYTPTTDSPITNYVPVLKTAAINEARLDHDPVTGECKGLLMEEARTNLCAYSENMATGQPYLISSINNDTNVVIAPNGTLTADKVIPVGDNGRRSDHFTIVGNMIEGDTYTISGFYKADGSHYTRVRLGGVFGGEDAIFDFETSEFVYQNIHVTNTKAEDVGNGWWRLSVTYVFQNHIGNNYPYALIAQPLLSNNSGSAPSYTGYNGVYVWGVQYEKASFASSYIPTNGAAVTRSRDIAIMDNIDSWVNKSEATIFYKTEYSSKADKNISHRGIFGVYHTSARRASSFGVLLSNISARENWVAAGVSDDNGNGVYSKEIGNLSNAFTGATSFNKDFSSVAATNVLTGTQSYGIDTTTSSSLGSLVPNRAIIGSVTDTAYQAVRTFNGCIECIRYYPQAMTQSELEALTQE